MLTNQAAGGPWDSGWRLALRISWIVVMLISAYVFAQSGELFFYQGF